MPRTNKTTVHTGSNGQYKVTVPAALAEAMKMDGKTVEWSIESSERLTVQVVDDK